MKNYIFPVFYGEPTAEKLASLYGVSLDVWRKNAALLEKVELGKMSENSLFANLCENGVAEYIRVKNHIQYGYGEFTPLPSMRPNGKFCTEKDRAKIYHLMQENFAAFALHRSFGEKVLKDLPGSVVALQWHTL